LTVAYTAEGARAAKAEADLEAHPQSWVLKAQANVDEAAQIVVDNDSAGAATIEGQTRMMGEIAKLTAGSNGALDEADYTATVAALMSGGSDPVITAEPAGAWTAQVTDKALQ
jgi:NitT/TauT family transport system substrate-binding protein